MRLASPDSSPGRCSGGGARQVRLARRAAVTAWSISLSPPRATSPRTAPVDGSMFGYVCAELTDAPSMKDSVTRSDTGVARHQAGSEAPRDVEAGLGVGHQGVLGPGADAHALGLQVPGGPVQVGHLEGERVVGVVGRGRG